MSHGEIDAILRERRLAAMRAEEDQASHSSHRSHGYDPNQPRVPKGHHDGGQWTTTEEGSELRIAESRGRGRNIWPALLLHLAAIAIDRHRKEKLLYDFFGNKIGTVATTTVNSEGKFGYNSKSPMYTAADEAEATRMREVLIRKYPDVMSQENIGQFPNEALFHAEANLLMKVAKENGGTLARQTIDVYVDREMCPSCEKVLPLIALELGNPTVKITDVTKRTFLIRNGIGKWLQ